MTDEMKGVRFAGSTDHAAAGELVQLRERLPELDLSLIGHGRLFQPELPQRLQAD